MEKYNIMNTSISASDVCADLGKKLKLARLAKNLTQIELSKITGISRGKIVEAEKGRGSTETLVTIMIALKIEQALKEMIPTDPRSPLEKLKSKGKQRERASGNSDYAKNEGFLEW